MLLMAPSLLFIRESVATTNCFYAEVFLNAPFAVAFSIERPLRIKFNLCILFVMALSLPSFFQERDPLIFKEE